MFSQVPSKTYEQAINADKTNEITFFRSAMTGIATAVTTEARPIITLAVPLISGLVSSTFVGLTDTFFLGPLGEVPLAAVSLTTSVMILLFSSLYGFMGPIGYLIGTAYGAGDARKVSQVVKHGAAIGVGTGLVGFLIMALALFALPYLGQPKAVLEIITPYWLFIAALLLPFCIGLAYKQFYDSMNKPWTGVALTLVGVLINIPLTWILVTGQFGLPAMGLTGAGAAGFISTTIGTSVMIAHFYLTPSHAPYHVKMAWTREAFKDQMREGLPMGIQYLFEGGAVAVAGMLVGLLGATALAANQIVFSVGGLLYMVPLGMSAAVGIRVAQAAGSGERRRARSIGFTGMGLVSLWTIAFTIVLMTSGAWVASQFVTEAAVIAIASLMFVSMGAMQIFDGIQSVGVGALRGIFDNRYPTVVSLIAYWLISLPLSILFGFVLGWGAPGVWAGFGVGLVVASILLVRRLYRKADAPEQAPA